MFMCAVVLLVNVAFVLTAAWKLLRLIDWAGVWRLACILWRRAVVPLRQAGGRQGACQAPHSPQK
jgi:hypothetical protein